MLWYILVVFVSLHCLGCTGFDIMSKFKVSLRGFNAQLSADTECKEVLMGAISGAMSASSSHPNHPPNNGRLLADTWWMPDQHDVFQYLKVDFSHLTVVRKSAVKGSGNSTAAGARVIAYHLHHSFDGDIWYPVLENENAKLFVGNLNNSAVISESSFPPFLARHVKFLPRHWHEQIALRVELYGCKSSGMDVAMGMEFKAIPDSAISATSQESSTFQPSNARLHQNIGGGASKLGTLNLGGWCAKSDLLDQPQYLQVLLDREWALIAVATQGIQSMQSWVSEYYLSTSFDRQIWVFAHDFNGKKLLKGNRVSAENVVVHHMPMFTWITALRIHPHAWERRICLRVELYGMDSTGSSNDTENNWCGAHGELRGPDAKPVKTCFCSPGYEGDGFYCAELDECTVGDNVCGSPDRQCTNTPGSFSCACGAGYTTTTLRNCEDIDECTVYGPKEICPFMTRCINTVGSYICQCMEPGFVGDGKQCVDIDECAIGNYTCGDNSACVNALGSYACFCIDGYTGRSSRDGKEQCSDINECESDSKRCSSNAECVNNEGSYQCICRQGYEVRGAQCRDIDECASGEADCKQDSQCINVPGSYACQCKLGYHLTGDLCQDVNECQQNLAECHHRADCYNTDGSYLCVCKSGFYGDGYYCSTSVECEKDHHACHDAVQGKEEHTEEHGEAGHDTP